jgi:cytochrome c oxidase assembly protein subunit 17
MGNNSSAPVVVDIPQQQPIVEQQQTSVPTSGPKCKICCACPSERRVRDECVIFNGMENCKEQIELFYTCLIKEGFTVEQVDQLRKKAKQ